MRIVRALLAVVVLIVAGLTVIGEPWTMQRCNIEKRKAEGFLDTAEQIVSDFDRQRGAAAVAARMEQCITDMPGDWQARFLAGAAYEVAGRVPTAEARYESALKLEERPEIYLALSLLQYANGEPEAGLRNAEKATGFNLKFANSYDSDLRAQLWWKAKERERRLKAEAH